MHSHTSVRSIQAVLILFAGTSLLIGCTAQDLQTLQQAHDQAVSTLGQAQAAEKQISQQVTTLPATDPVREALEPKLDQLDQIIKQIQSYVPVLNATIASAGTGQIDPVVQQAAAAIPYGSLALAVIAVVFGVIKHVQAGTLSAEGQQTQKAFQQLVDAMHAAIPSPSPEQQAKVDSVLDTDVKAKVAAARAG